MFRKVFKQVTALAIVSCVLAAGAVAAGGGAGGGGGTGGGSTKPLTFRITGSIVGITPTIGGVNVTLGTSYYPVGTALITSDTKIKLNGDSSATVAELRLGDVAQIDMNWISKMATKVEATGLR